MIIPGSRCSELASGGASRHTCSCWEGTEHRWTLLLTPIRLIGIQCCRMGGDLDIFLFDRWENGEHWRPLEQHELRYIKGKGSFMFEKHMLWGRWSVVLVWTAGKTLSIRSFLVVFPCSSLINSSDISFRWFLCYFTLFICLFTFYKKSWQVFRSIYCANL